MGGLVAPAARPQPRWVDTGARFAVAVHLCVLSPAAARSQNRSENVDGHEVIVLSVAVMACLLAFCIFSAVVAPKLLGFGPRRPAVEEERQKRKEKRAVTTEQILERLPPAKTPRNSDGDGQPNCVVCLCEVDVDEESITTQCGHTFHKDCVLQWWTHKPRQTIRCPTCRTKQKIRVKKSRDSSQLSPRADPAEEAHAEGDGDANEGTPTPERQESWMPDLEAGRRSGPLAEPPAPSPHAAAPADLAHRSAADEATPMSQVSELPPLQSPPVTGDESV